MSTYSLIAALGCAVCSSTLFAADLATASWPTFRGVGRTATAPDTDLLESWPPSGPQLDWEIDGLGRGYSSVAIADGRIYTMGDNLPSGDKDVEYLICLDQASGKLIWKTKTGDAWNNGKDTWQSSRSTPTIDSDHIYAVNPHGQLTCCTTGGEVVWQRDLKEDFAGNKADSWGYSESPLIDGDHVIVCPGGAQNTMVALNKQTGEQVWSSQRENDRGAGHASIVITEIGGTKVYVTTTGSGAMGVRANDGKLLWTYDIDKTTAVIPTPIVRDDYVFFAAGYGRGGALLKQTAGEDEGTVTVEEIYPLNPELANKHGGIVLVGDHLYGDSDDKGIPFCAEFLTGKQVWQSRGAGKGSAAIAAADGHLYIRYNDGTMTLVKASPDGFEESGKFKISGSGERPSWAHPVIVAGKLYLRENDKLLCYSITQ